MASLNYLMICNARSYLLLFCQLFFLSMQIDNFTYIHGKRGCIMGGRQRMLPCHDSHSSFLLVVGERLCQGQCQKLAMHSRFHGEGGGCKSPGIGGPRALTGVYSIRKLESEWHFRVGYRCLNYQVKHLFLVVFN